MAWVSTILVTVLGPVLIGLAAAVILLLVRRVGSGPTDGAWTGRGPAALGIGLALALTLVTRVLAVTGILPRGPQSLRIIPFAMPLAAGAIAVIVVGAAAVHSRRSMAAATPARVRTASADLLPRTMTSFVAPGWLILLGVLATAVVTAAVAAGIVSRRDDEGHFTQYLIGSESQAAEVPIYGWYFSLPCLVLLVLLLIGAAIILRAIALPPLGEDPLAATCDRRRRTHAVLATVSGALLIHLSVVLGHLASVAGFTLRVSDETLTVEVGASFAALESVLEVLAWSTGIAGWFGWFAVALLAVTGRPRALQASRQEVVAA